MIQSYSLYKPQLVNKSRGGAKKTTVHKITTRWILTIKVYKFYLLTA